MTKKITIALIVILIVILSGVAFWYQYEKWNQKGIQPIVATSTPAQPINATITIATTTQTNDHPGMKRYRNTEWGFEFWYPEGWEWKENVFGSPFSKFNLTLMRIKDKNTNQDTVLNIVVPEFAKNATRSISAIDPRPIEITVDGERGMKYSFLHEGPSELIVDFPFNEYHILLGVASWNESELNTIVSTFKFLK